VVAAIWPRRALFALCRYSISLQPINFKSLPLTSNERGSLIPATKGCPTGRHEQVLPWHSDPTLNKHSPSPPPPLRTGTTPPRGNQAFLCAARSSLFIVFALPGALSPIHSLGSSPISFAAALSSIPIATRHDTTPKQTTHYLSPNSPPVASRICKRCEFAPSDNRSVPTPLLARIDTC